MVKNVTNEIMTLNSIVDSPCTFNVFFFCRKQDVIVVTFILGCEYHGYASDITRTWPVNGKFTDPQRVIYEIVLEVQKELIELCNKMPTLDALFECMCLLLGKKLQSCGLIGTQPSNNYLMKVILQIME